MDYTDEMKRYREMAVKAREQERMREDAHDREMAAQYLSKGSSVLIEGKLAPDKQTGRPVIWTGQDGTPRANYDLTADRIVLLGSRGDSSSAGDSAPEPPASAEDIPF